MSCVESQDVRLLHLLITLFTCDGQPFGQPAPPDASRTTTSSQNSASSSTLALNHGAYGTGSSSWLPSICCCCGACCCVQTVIRVSSNNLSVFEALIILFCRPLCRVQGCASGSPERLTQERIRSKLRGKTRFVGRQAAQAQVQASIVLKLLKHQPTRCSSKFRT